MGIPVYFKTLLTEYDDLLIVPNKIDNLFLDLNCLIHPCCRNEDNETIMIQNIIYKINSLINFTNVNKLLYIAIDGVPPRAKMEQQIIRRIKSSKENKIWDTNAITPGTHFMKTLNIELNKWIQNNTNNIKIILNDSSIRGEGEHKILDYLKSNRKLDNYINIIYGLDADLIMLSLLSEYNNLYLLRERTEYNIENINDEYIYLNIPKLKEKIIANSNIDVNNTDQFIRDYIFICFFLGNDFIKHLPGFQLRYNGLDKLLECYNKLQEEYHGYFFIIHLDSNLIYLPFFKEFIKLLEKAEWKQIESILNIRNIQSKKMEQNYGNIYREFKDIKGRTLNDLYLVNENKETKEYYKEMLNNYPILDRTDEINIFQSKDMWRDNYYKYYNICHSLQGIESLCKEYFESLLWTTHYYFKGCHNWKQYYKYKFAPSVKDFYNYIKDINNLSKYLIFDNEELSIRDCLYTVLPNSSMSLISLHDKHKKKEVNYEIKLLFKRYLWECE